MNMKKKLGLLHISIAILFMCPAGVLCQTTVKYTYNNAGSRTARHVITLKQAQTDSTTQADKDSKTETFEDAQGTQKITIYPNPTQGRLVIDIQGSDATSGTAVYLYNLSGTLLICKDPAESSNTLDLSGYPAGTYVLRIRVGDKKSEWKVVKE
jgi:hypothetical protein